MAILLDCPLFIDQQWGKSLSLINNGNYDFVALIHWSGLAIYDFKTNNYSYAKIGREDMDALKRLGRMAAEGIIKDDDPVIERRIRALNYQLNVPLAMHD